MSGHTGELNEINAVLLEDALIFAFDARIKQQRQIRLAGQPAITLQFGFKLAC